MFPHPHLQHPESPRHSVRVRAKQTMTNQLLLEPPSSGGDPQLGRLWGKCQDSRLTETVGTQVRAQGHRADRLLTAVPGFGTQGSWGKGALGLSSLPGHGLEGGHILSIRKPS